jgi:rusticyanin
MTRKRIGIMIGAAVAAAGLGAGIAAAVVTGSPGPAPGRRGTASIVTAAPPYSYYQSMMSRYYGGAGSMMGGGYGWMMGSAGYRWMFGGAGAPAWMRGAHLPATMMGTRTDMGQVMGRLWAGAPGPRVSAGRAAALGGQGPAGAVVSRPANTITFTTSTVSFAAVASPAGGPDETFRIAGLVNPKVIVPAGSQVTIQVINADPDTTHGLVITSAADHTSWMPMMTDRPAFTGSALWFLGNPTTAGMHTATMTFTATTSGTYRYLCPVPGHARKGMTGQFTVTAG